MKCFLLKLRYRQSYRELSGNGVEPHVNGVLEVWRRRDLRTLFISVFPPAACHATHTVSHYQHHNQHTPVWDEAMHLHVYSQNQTLCKHLASNAEEFRCILTIVFSSLNSCRVTVFTDKTLQLEKTRNNNGEIFFN